jgi:hypothetical protein
MSKQWVMGRWTIYDEDRAAQVRKEPYWTLEAGEDGIAEGPVGRKAMDPEFVVRGSGWECDGIAVSEEDARLICAAPALLEALKAVLSVADRKTKEFDAARAAITKAEGSSLVCAEDKK